MRTPTATPEYTYQDLRALLPQVGDMMEKIPACYSAWERTRENIAPKPCRVVYVNPDHLMYTVQYGSGYRESYKVPDIRTDYRGRLVK